MCRPSAFGNSRLTHSPAEDEKCGGGQGSQQDDQAPGAQGRDVDLRWWADPPTQLHVELGIRVASEPIRADVDVRVEEVEIIFSSRGAWR